jgi:DNA-binding NtrC family response regulator
MLELYRRIALSARTDAVVLIEGETGVGKELVARALHRESRRANGPFVAVNASTIPEPLFESELFGHVKGAFSGAHENHRGLAAAAHRGTLFIDEIGELPCANQAKLLRFLDTREVRPVGGVQSSAVDSRIVCATNRDLQRAVEERTFRADLFYRLRAIWLRVPSLRERRNDLPLLIAHFLRDLCRCHRREVPTVSAEAMERMLAYRWPGNVRELKHELAQAVVLTPAGEEIGPRALTSCARKPDGAGPGAELLVDPQGVRSLTDCREQAEREAISATLHDLGWNVSAAARALDISRVGLTRKLKALGIRRPGGAGPSRSKPSRSSPSRSNRQPASPPARYGL